MAIDSERVKRIFLPIPHFDISQIKTVLSLYYEGKAKRDPRDRPLNILTLQLKTTTSTLTPDHIPSTAESIVGQVTHDEVGEALSRLRENQIYYIEVWISQADPLAKINETRPEATGERKAKAIAKFARTLINNVLQDRLLR